MSAVKFRAVEEVPLGAPVGLFAEGEVGKARYDTRSAVGYLGIACKAYAAGDEVLLEDLVRDGVVPNILGVLTDEEVEAKTQIFIGEGSLTTKMPSIKGARVVLVGMALNKTDLLAYWQYVGQVSAK
jgi:hypothetical protein